MNINKINNQLQYWHDVNELPKKGVPILIEAKINTTNYFIAEFTNINAYYQFKTINLNDSNHNDPLKNDINNMLNKNYHTNWYNVVNKWIYLTDLKEILE